ncbi:MAG: A/G-specific adenine glycosylase [Flavobacteriales bacterium]|nr:A/G-specific adenine glycosylase [Flavobacteriales bacterium]
MLQFQVIILDWYNKNKRNLPWRDTNNPYFIWLSEIILQQTRVDQGLPYFEKFANHYPSVFELANADEQNILNDWQGLGYYSRARNLHKTAKELVNSYNGEFPSTYTELLKLTGIGPYTAAAIASFAFNEAKAVVDGNVYRVLSRVFDIEEAIDSTQGKKNFELLANELIDKKNPASYNQAIMEFGALQCVPVNPDCSVCPLQFQCLAYKNKTITERPVKSKKTKVTSRYFVYLIELSVDKTIRIEKREGKGIWQNLYQFPLVEFDSIEEKSTFLERLKSQFISKEYKHILSHQQLFAHFAIVEPSKKTAVNQLEIAVTELSNFPIPRLIDKFWEEHFKFVEGL